MNFNIKVIQGRLTCFSGLFLTNNTMHGVLIHILLQLIFPKHSLHTNEFCINAYSSFTDYVNTIHRSWNVV